MIDYWLLMRSNITILKCEGLKTYIYMLSNLL